MDKLNQGLDRLLYTLSTYALPILIGLVSLLALFAWKTQYPVVDPQQLQIRVIQRVSRRGGTRAGFGAVREGARSSHSTTPGFPKLLSGFLS